MTQIVNKVASGIIISGNIILKLIT